MNGIKPLFSLSFTE